MTELDLAPTILAMCQSGAAHGAALRVGVDVVSVDWFTRQLRHGDDCAFVRTAFTPAERTYSAGRPERYAARWAAKEAVAKAIGTGFRGLRPGDIEVLHHPDGRAEVVPTVSAWPNEAHDWVWELTLCHEAGAALAVAVGAIPPPQPRRPQAP